MSTESSGSGQQSDSEIGRPRLLQRVHEAIRVRHYSRRTEEAYVHWIKRLIYFHGKRHPREYSADGVLASAPQEQEHCAAAAVGGRGLAEGQHFLPQRQPLPQHPLEHRFAVVRAEAL